jgi:hypothetical protein
VVDIAFVGIVVVAIEDSQANPAAAVRSAVLIAAISDSTEARAKRVVAVVVGVVGQARREAVVSSWLGYWQLWFAAIAVANAVVLIVAIIGDSTEERATGKTVIAVVVVEEIGAFAASASGVTVAASVAIVVVVLVVVVLELKAANRVV